MLEILFFLLFLFSSITFLILKFYSISILDSINFIRICLRNFPRDLRAFIYYLRVHYFVFKCKLLNSSVQSLFSKVVKKFPDKIAIYYKDEKWTFKQLDDFSNQVANCFINLGYRPNDELALLMDNRPEFIGIWLGLAKTGIISAFINTKNRNDTLIHSIKVVNCKAIIFDAKLYKSIAEVVSHLSEINSEFKYYCYGNIEDAEIQKLIPSEPLHQLISNSLKDLPINIHKSRFNDKLFYLFTSGTTGYPKAAIIPHHRYLWGGTTPRIVLGIGEEDIIYVSLPLFHGNAGTLGVSQAIIHGSSIVLREKFSPKNFWDDCVKYECTVAIYIGEICRYLLAQPPKINDQKHQIRVMFGNGLRPQIWRQFKERFGIKLIGEFYAATEGNANLINFVGHEGSCGFYPYYYWFFVKYLYPISLLKVDPITFEVIRDENGLCVVAKAGDMGELVGKILENDPISQFCGYVSQEDSKKKVIENVFKFGDKAFLSGDLMVMDDNGFLRFKDRTGDTFRWKGENVSTAEVEAIIQKVTKLSDCVVIGVTVGQCEGKAGMAIISTQNNNQELDLKQIAEDLKQQLPPYAIPIFIRITEKIELTGSYKLTKFKFMKTGFNPNLINDSVYFFDKNSDNYIKLDSKLYEEIQNGKIRI